MVKDMNKPVAWMNKDVTSWLSCTNQHPETEIDEWLPLYTHPVKEPIYRFDDEMLTELITTMDSVDAYMEAERRGFNDAKWKDIANNEWQYLMKLIYQAVARIEKNGEAHPVKELTDFEIKGVLAQDECWVGEDCSIPDMIAFAKAILRKAQEK